MLKVGLTGNIGSGFIQVADIFKVFGVPVFDADIATKFVINYREDIIRNIKIQFGSDIYNKGLIDEKKFNTTEKFDRLLDIVEPHVLKLYDSWRLSNKDATYTIFKSSILFERKLEKNFSYIITTFKPRDERAGDLVKNSNISLINSYSIIESEMDELIKNQSSNWIIHNYDRLSLLTQSKEIHDSLESKSIKGLLSKIDMRSLTRNIFS